MCRSLHLIKKQTVKEDLERISERYLACAGLLGSTRGPEERAQSRQIARSAAAVAKAIFSTPATLISVDLSVKNMLLKGFHRPAPLPRVRACRVCPAAMTLGLIGEASELVPAGSLGERAKEAFLDGWSGSVSAPLKLEVFQRSQRCARLYLKCHDLGRFFESILTNPGLLHKPPWRGWWLRDSPELARLVRAVHRELG